MSDIVIIADISSYNVPFQDDLIIDVSRSYDPDLLP